MVKSHIPKDLLEELEQSFKERGVRPGEDPSVSFYASGARDVVVYLRNCYEKQQQSVADELYNAQLTKLPHERS